MSEKHRPYYRRLTPDEVRKERERTERRSKMLFQALLRSAMDG